MQLGRWTRKLNRNEQELLVLGRHWTEESWKSHHHQSKHPSTPNTLLLLPLTQESAIFTFSPQPDNFDTKCEWTYPRPVS